MCSPLITTLAEPGLTVTIYAAEPGSPTEQALTLLASWAATNDPQLADQTQALGREARST